MADNNQPIEWYLARDGQQHGPVTDEELRKIIELGYLRPTDLVWRQGMPEWAPAETVLDLRTAPQAARPTIVQPNTAPTNQAGIAPRQSETVPGAGERRHAQQDAAARPQQAALPGAGHSRSHAPMAKLGTTTAGSDAKPAPSRPSRDTTPSGYEAASARDQIRSRGFPWRAAVALIAIGILAAGGLALYKTGTFSDLPFLAAPVTSDGVPVVSRPSESAREATTTSSTDPANLPQPIEQRLQTSPLWKVLQRNFPEWYNERVAEVAKLSNESKSQREIEAALTRSIVDLRRRHQNDALAANPDRLEAMAAAFVDSLARLSKISTSACYGYISQGEASPAIADLTAPEHRGAIDAQLATIFDAIAEGRQSPTQREQPRREDYDVLSKELGQRGWSAADLQLFTDARALSRAAPEKVCQMVQDWFTAQLAVQDQAVKFRLLGEALKPVVAG